MTYIIIRYEEYDDTLFAVCENKNGDRWYEILSVKGEFVF